MGGCLLLSEGRGAGSDGCRRAKTGFTGLLGGALVENAFISCRFHELDMLLERMSATGNTSFGSLSSDLSSSFRDASTLSDFTTKTAIVSDSIWTKMALGVEVDSRESAYRLLGGTPPTHWLVPRLTLAGLRIPVTQAKIDSRLLENLRHCPVSVGTSNLLVEREMVRVVMHVALRAMGDVTQRSWPRPKSHRPTFRQPLLAASSMRNFQSTGTAHRRNYRLLNEQIFTLLRLPPVRQTFVFLPRYIMSSCLSGQSVNVSSVSMVGTMMDTRSAIGVMGISTARKAPAVVLQTVLCLGGTSGSCEHSATLRLEPGPVRTVARLVCPGGR
jgi:hypothetical protein